MTTDISKTTRGPWGVAVEITPSLFRIRLKNTSGSLMVNTYVYVCDDAVAVFDPGWPWTLPGLEDALEEMGIGTLHEVTHWIYTHTHIDHMGGAAILGRQSDAPHITFSGGETHLNKWHLFQDEMHSWVNWAKEWIDDKAVVDRFRQHVRISDGMVKTFGAGEVVNVVLVDHGETIRVGDLELRIIDAKGHDPLHIVFYEPNKKWLFGGDVVLTTPTPIARAMQDSLSEYVDSLNRLKSLDVDLLLPGHGVHRFGEYPSSIQRSLQHVTTYTQNTKAALKSMPGPLGLVGLSMAVFPKLFEQNQTQLVVNLGLIDSHIHEMVSTGEVEVSPGPRYKIV